MALQRPTSDFTTIAAKHFYVGELRCVIITSRLEVRGDLACLESIENYACVATDNVECEGRLVGFDQLV